MSDEVLFINDQGGEVYLPESAGKALGLRRASEFTPKESQAKVKTQDGVSQLSDDDRLSDAIATVHAVASRGEETVNRDQKAGLKTLSGHLVNYGFGNIPKGGADDAKSEQEHAMTVLYGVAMNGAESVSAEVEDGLNRLTERLLENGFGPRPVEGQDEHTGEPSLIDAIATLEKQIDADTKKTPAQKKKLKEHLQELLDNAAPTSTPPADTPPAE